MTKLVSRRSGPLQGDVRVPGDKSVSHRALLIAANAVGETRIRGLLESEDVLATAAAVRALSATVSSGGGVWRVAGRGVGGLCEPSNMLDMGNSGTSARLLMGVAASLPVSLFFTGDESLSRRPMGRVLEPLRRMGAEVWSRSGERLPLVIRGSRTPLPIEYTPPVPSAQVKSAVLLAGLAAPGATTVIEARATRDHTERMLAHFGADITVETLEGDGRRVTVRGPAEISGCDVSVPGDFSSAAFPLVAASIVPGSSLRLRGVGINPGRTGLFDTLREMGARLSVSNAREDCGEPIADIVAEAAPLRGVTVAAARAPLMIDEFPVLAAAAACAEGETRMEGLAELRVKESDRLAAIINGLRACGVTVEAGDDWLMVRGCGGAPSGGGLVAVHHDHRIAMAFLVLGAASTDPVCIDDEAPIATSFPGFVALAGHIGMRVTNA